MCRMGVSGCACVYVCVLVTHRGLVNLQREPEAVSERILAVCWHRGASNTGGTDGKDVNRPSSLSVCVCVSFHNLSAPALLHREECPVRDPTHSSFIFL